MDGAFSIILELLVADISKIVYGILEGALLSAATGGLTGDSAIFPFGCIPRGGAGGISILFPEGDNRLARFGLEGGFGVVGRRRPKTD